MKMNSKLRIFGNKEKKMSTRRLTRSALFIGFCVFALSTFGNGSSASAAATSTSNYPQHAADGVQQMQNWYVQSSGLYETPTGWWNAANSITVLVDYSRATNTTQYLSAVSNTFANANKANGSTNFITSANDDEGWWALAWMDAYDLTNNAAYLTMAQTIFADMAGQWNTTTCGGGVWWSKDLTTSAYKNAITNEIFLELAAGLANRTTNATKKAQYLAWAQKEWQWFSASGMINSKNLINDGLNATNPNACTNNGQTTWTYNQGVILGGLVELYKADHDSTLLPKAQAIASAAMTNLVTSSGVLHEPSISGPDQPQFKGIFIRNLYKLSTAVSSSEYKTFVDTNANSIWGNDQGSNYEFGVHWEGPFDSGDATRQASALDCLNAAMEMQGPVGIFEITSVQSGLALDGGANKQGTLVQMWTSNATVDQQWILYASGSGTGIASVQSGLVLDGGTNATGTNPQMWTSNGTVDQQWIFNSSGSGYSITSVQSGLVLDGGTNATGANPQMWTSNGTVDQQWILTPIP
jgi:predicted alpha-1,6-mannanase (GH76 family)